MRYFAVIFAMSFVLLPTFAGAGASTGPATAPATQPARRLGIVLMDVTQYADAQNQIRAFGGHLVVNLVNPGTRAERMGLRPGDAIQRINGAAMETVHDVMAAVRDAESLRIEIIRGQAPLTLDEASDSK